MTEDTQRRIELIRQGWWHLGRYEVDRFIVGDVPVAVISALVPVYYPQYFGYLVPETLTDKGVMLEFLSESDFPVWLEFGYYMAKGITLTELETLTLNEPLVSPEVA